MNRAPIKFHLLFTDPNPDHPTLAGTDYFKGPRPGMVRTEVDIRKLTSGNKKLIEARVSRFHHEYGWQLVSEIADQKLAEGIDTAQVIRALLERYVLIVMGEEAEVEVTGPPEEMGSVRP